MLAQSSCAKAAGQIANKLTLAYIRMLSRTGLQKAKLNEKAEKGEVEEHDFLRPAEVPRLTNGIHYLLLALTQSMFMPYNTDASFLFMRMQPFKDKCRIQFIS